MPPSARHGESFGIYSLTDLVNIKKQALLWLNILTSTKKSRLHKNVMSRIQKRPDMVVWDARLVAALCEMGDVLRNTKRQDKLLFVYACMIGDLSTVQLLLGNTRPPTYLSMLPGVKDNQNRLLFANSANQKIASEQLIWLFMPTACLRSPQDVKDQPRAA